MSTYVFDQYKHVTISVISHWVICYDLLKCVLHMLKKNWDSFVLLPFRKSARNTCHMKLMKTIESPMINCFSGDRCGWKSGDPDGGPSPDGAWPASVPAAPCNHGPIQDRGDQENHLRRQPGLNGTLNIDSFKLLSVYNKIGCPLLGSQLTQYYIF